MATDIPAAKKAAPQESLANVAGDMLGGIAAVNATPAEHKPIKESVAKTGLQTKLPEISSAEPKEVKKYLSSPEAIAWAPRNKSGFGEFTTPSLCEGVSVPIPAQTEAQRQKSFHWRRGGLFRHVGNFPRESSSALETHGWRAVITNHRATKRPTRAGL